MCSNIRKIRHFECSRWCEFAAWTLAHVRCLLFLRETGGALRSFAAERCCRLHQAEANESAVSISSSSLFNRSRQLTPTAPALSPAAR